MERFDIEQSRVKLDDLGSGSKRALKDYKLTRYACYPIAQNGDPRKEEIAFAQRYFGLQMRKQELIEERMKALSRIEVRGRMSEAEKEFSRIAYERGVDAKGFGRVRSRGDEALFGGNSTACMKKRLGVVASKSLADHLLAVTLAAKSFAMEMANFNVQEKDLQGEPPIADEHVQSNLGVRSIRPEELLVEEDVRKLERRVMGDDRKLERGTQGFPAGE